MPEPAADLGWAQYSSSLCSISLAGRSYRFSRLAAIDKAAAHRSCAVLKCILAECNGNYGMIDDKACAPSLSCFGILDRFFRD